MAIALFSLGGFAHRTISVLFNTLSAEIRSPPISSIRARSVRSAASHAWRPGPAGLDFPCSSVRSPTLWATVHRPLFGLLGVLELVGAAALVALIGGERHAERYAAA
jgi:hypothetical protein